MMSTVEKVSVSVLRKAAASPGQSREPSSSLGSLGSPSTQGKESPLSGASGDQKLAAPFSL